MSQPFPSRKSLLGTVYSGAEKRSDLAVFDVAMIRDGHIAFAELSHHLRSGFHGA